VTLHGCAKRSPLTGCQVISSHATGSREDPDSNRLYIYIYIYIQIIVAVTTTATSTTSNSAATTISNGSHFHLSVQHNFNLSQSQGTVQSDLSTKDTTPNSPRARHGDIYEEILNLALGESELLASLSVSFTTK